MDFSKLGSIFKSGGDDHGRHAVEPVFQSHHLTAERVGPALCVRVRCEAVSDREARILFDETESLLDPRDRGLVVDLAEVTVLTSAGIGALVRLSKHLTDRKGTFAVCGLSEELDELFRLTRMDRLFVIKPDREAALAEIRA